MIPQAILTILASLIIYSAIKIFLIIQSSEKAKREFRKLSPNLTIPPVGLFASLLNLFDKYNWLIVDQFHARYGKTMAGFLFNRAAVITIDLDLIKRIVLDRPFDNLGKFKIGIYPEFEVDNIGWIEGEQWKRVRKAFAQALSTHRIRSPNVQRQMRQVVSNLIESIDIRLNEASTKLGENFIEFDAEDLFHRYTIDLSLTCFYKKSNLINYLSAEEKWLTDAEKSERTFVNPLIILSVIFPFMKPFTNWLVSNFHFQGRFIKRILSFITEQSKLYFKAKKELREARENNVDEIIDGDNFILKDGTEFRRSISDYVVEELEKGKLTKQEYLHTSYFLFVASHKSSADAVSKLLYLLAKNQSIQDKLRKSIQKDGTESQYLMWCINETLRLYPPAMVGSSRTISHDVVSSNDELIPKNTLVITPLYTIHRFKEYWGDDANEFNPDRFSKQESFHPCQFFPFGIGPRICPGKEFVLTEMRMLLDILMRKFKFETTLRTPNLFMFTSQLFIFNFADVPTYLRVTRFEQDYEETEMESKMEQLLKV